MQYEVSDVKIFQYLLLLGRNDLLNGVGSKILLLKKLIIFVFFLYVGKYFSILALL